MSQDLNIFSTLGKYSSATDENYLTESFVFLINELLRRDPSFGTALLNHVCVINSEFHFVPEETIQVTTQEVTKHGTPDIKISSPDKLMYIEVKHDSPVGDQQISKYKNALLESRAIIKHVILLTRYDIDLQNSNPEEMPYKHIKWLHVYQFLSNELPPIIDPISKYLVGSFLRFLEVKQMSIQKVGWEYIKGVPEMMNLLGMIEFCIENAGIKLYQQYPRAIALESRGFYLHSTEIWCGIYYSDPLNLLLQLVDKKKFDVHQVPKPTYDVEEDNKSIWFSLGLEECHFFSLNKDEQIDVISSFIKQSFSEAQQMKATS